MNNFEPKSIKEASQYLQDKLNLFKRGGARLRENKSVYIIQDKKDSVMKRLVGGFFKT